MNKREVIDRLAEESGLELMVMNGYDDCIVGVVEAFGGKFSVLYDRSKVIDKLMADGMSFEEATEFHEFNQIGAYVGEHTPLFLDRIDVLASVVGPTSVE